MEAFHQMRLCLVSLQNLVNHRITAAYTLDDLSSIRGTFDLNHPQDAVDDLLVDRSLAQFIVRLLEQTLHAILVESMKDVAR
jgi:hypothetical protein